MIKQTILLFIRALIIGLVLNLVIHQATGVSVSQQSHQQIQSLYHLSATK